MARIDQKLAPYYGFLHNDDYSQILFKPGTHIQAGELNEQQLMISRDLRNVADTILTDGDVIEGAQIIIDINNKEVTVTDGNIYLEGKVRSFKKQTVPIKAIGIENIGVKINDTIIDSNIDKDLLSKASGFENYGLSGADRLKQTTTLVVDDDEASIIYTIKDGNLINDKTNTDTTFIDKLNALLARRTYDQSGHYKVWGLELSQKEQYDEDYLYLSLSEGKAYVQGWEIDKQSATTLPVERAKDLREILAEPKTYETGTDRYSLNNGPVSRIKRLVSVVSVKTDMTRQGAVNGSDPIQSQYTPVVDIQSITNKTGDKTYKKNVDYQLESNSVRWLNGGQQPDLGATYTITFTYNKIMQAETDYKLISDQGTYYLEFTSKGDKPVNKSQIQVDYDFYLAYMLSITLDKDGIVRSVRGQSNRLEDLAPPDISDQSVLLLGNVVVQPVNDNLIIYNSRNLRSSMADIIRMAERIEDMEMNQAITDLDKEAMEGEEPTLLKGIFTDGFLGFSKSDINHAEYDAAIDLLNSELTLGFNTTVNNLVLDKTKTTNARAYSRLITADSEDKRADYQPYATEAFRINPYTAFESGPHLELSPAVDNWVDTSNIVLERDGGSRVEYRNLAPISTRSIVWSRSDEGTSTTTSTVRTESRTERKTSTRVISSAIEYMRQRDIKFKATGFGADQTGIVVFFNDLPIKTTPSNLQADSEGVVTGTFTVPKNIRCGTVKVSIYAKDLPNYKGSANYTANGQIRTTITTNTKTTIRTVYRQQRIVRYVDPISQTFSLEKDQVLNSIGIYFSDIERTKPVRVQIRECDNGYPNNTVLAETIIPTDAIQVSTKANLETKVNFSNPVFLEKDVQYAFTVLTTSNKSSLWVQELNGRDVTTGEIVSQNPYVPGLMFSSSNALAWTTHQTKNIKFNLYVNDFKKKSTVYFDSIRSIDIDSFKLIADTSVPVDTNLTWEYSSDEGKTWNPCAPNQLLDLSNSIDNITVRANIEAKSNVSPAIASDSLLMVGYKFNEKSNYISKNVKTDADFTEVKIVADIDAPSGTGVVFYYATDINGKDWKTLKQEGEPKVKVVGSYEEFTYKATTKESRNFRVKAVLSTNNTSIRPKVKNLKCIIK